MDVTLPISLHTDSTAARGMAMRSGQGKAKHMQTRMLWLQGCLKREDMKLCKIHTDLNSADLHTKYLPEQRINFLLARSCQEAREGSAKGALEVEADLERIDGDSPLKAMTVKINCLLNADWKHE